MKTKGLSKTPKKTRDKQTKNEVSKAQKEKKGLLKKIRRLKRRTIVILVCFAMGIIITIVGLVLYLKPTRSGNRPNFPFGNMQGGGNQFIVTGDMVAASGVTSVGVTEESFDVENLTTALEIEEVYIASDDVIEEGTKILKLSEASIAEAREELEQTLKEADLAYRSGSIEYEQSKITAEYDRDSTILSGEQAKAVYNETISSLKDSVEKALEELNQAKEDIAEYQSYVNNDTYKSYFKVDEYQAIYDETLAALKAKMEDWEVSWEQVSSQGGGTMMGNSNTTPGAAMSVDKGFNTGPTSDQIKVLSSLYQVVEKQRQTLEQAQSDYEDALTNAAFELQTLELQLPELENALAEAEKNYQNQILQAELTYETSLTNAKSAESDYETAIQQAETNFESLKKDWEDARENLELFESSVGDGYFYASGSGTILRTMVRAGQNLTSEATVFMYSNPKEMSVTVSVDQTSISSVALNDSVYIQSGEYGGFEGVVTEINPISNSESRTNVTYNITVKFVGDSTEVPANESVTVIFGMDTETIQNMLTMSSQTIPRSTSEDSQMPEGFERPEGGQMPEGSAPNSGNTGNK